MSFPNRRSHLRTSDFGSASRQDWIIENKSGSAIRQDWIEENKSGSAQRAARLDRDLSSIPSVADGQ